jgi:PadR family transcriptional regulator PadR
VADHSLLYGTLDLLILRVLAWGDNHGYGIARWIKDGSGDALIVEDRALYLALHRLETRRLVVSSWGLSAGNRRAKYYRLTAPGKRQLREHIADWHRYSEAVTQIIERDSPVPA